ncbi:MAG: hypothetical protein KatS3mg056_1607 [Chloroflexus sp.]|nr:MAG: hypothetical protein KatS3mg056_1607 [Chloroflexus sp.]
MLYQRSARRPCDGGSKSYAFPLTRCDLSTPFLSIPELLKATAPALQPLSPIFYLLPSNFSLLPHSFTPVARVTYRYGYALRAAPGGKHAGCGSMAAALQTLRHGYAEREAVSIRCVTPRVA